MYKKAEPLYGAPRGNRVMAAKRTTGPSANVTLNLHVALEKCSVKGCTARVLVTKNHTGVHKERFCSDHLSKPIVRTRSVRDLLKLPWE